VQGQDGGVDDAQPGDAADTQLGVNDIVGLRAHGAGADGVVDARAGLEGGASMTGGLPGSRPLRWTELVVVGRIW
jgi:hypothetical protein